MCEDGGRYLEMLQSAQSMGEIAGIIAGTTQQGQSSPWRRVYFFPSYSKGTESFCLDGSIANPLNPTCVQKKIF